MLQLFILIKIFIRIFIIILRILFLRILYAPCLLRNIFLFQLLWRRFIFRIWWVRWVWRLLFIKFPPFSWRRILACLTLNYPWWLKSFLIHHFSCLLIVLFTWLGIASEPLLMLFSLSRSPYTPLHSLSKTQLLIFSKRYFWSNWRSRILLYSWP